MLIFISVFFYKNELASYIPTAGKRLPIYSQKYDVDTHDEINTQT